MVKSSILSRLNFIFDGRKLPVKLCRKNFYKNMNENKSADFENVPGIRHLLDEILLRIQGILNEKLIGFYLYGSLVAGDFDYEVSDIDLLAATASVIDENEFAALEKMHAGVIEKFPNWENRVEIQYVSLEALRTFKRRNRRSPISVRRRVSFSRCGARLAFELVFCARIGRNALRQNARRNYPENIQNGIRRNRTRAGF